MACTAYSPNLTAREQAQYLYEAIPPGVFKVENEEERIPWRISPEPFALSPESLARIENIGKDLLLFYRGLNSLYNRSARGTAPAFIAEYLDEGKPEHIIRLQRQNRTKQDIPGVIRPDIILTDAGMIASELDSVPGGMGFVGAMGEAYCEVGFDQIGEYDGVVRGDRIELEHGAHLADGLRVEIRPQTHVEEDADPNAAVLRGLRAAGLIENEPSLPRRGPAPFDPVEARGEPLSEQIIRERR